MAVIESDWLAMLFVDDMFMDEKYITTASGKPIHSWLTIYTIRLSFTSYNDVVKVKVVI